MTNDDGPLIAALVLVIILLIAFAWLANNQPPPESKPIGVRACTPMDRQPAAEYAQARGQPLHPSFIGWRGSFF